MSRITKALIVVVLIVGLSVGGMGVAVADKPAMDDCENAESGAEFSVPEDVADNLEDKNPNVDCEDDGGHGGR